MRRHKPGDGSRCSEVSTTMELHRLQEESVSWGACCGVLDGVCRRAGAEAGSGKTCAVDVQAADACHVVSASFVWGGPKNRDGDFMDGAVVVVLNADGKAFLAHNMVLCDDDQWTCELVGFPAQGLSNDTFTFVLGVCATLWRPLNASLGKIARLICCCLHKIIA